MQGDARAGRADGVAESDRAAVDVDLVRVDAQRPRRRQADRGERQLTKILEALAVMQATGAMPFAHLIANEGMRLNRNDTVLAISADPSPDWPLALHHLQRRGVNSIAVVIDGTTFGGKTSYDGVFAQLDAGGVPTYTVRRNDDLVAALGRPSRLAEAPDWIAAVTG